MGEIKSTLDLVMERTKSLTMTDDEKKTHLREKIGKRVTGLIQKINDQAIKPEEITSQLQELRDQFGSGSTNSIVHAALEGIKIDAENEGRLTLLSKHLQIDITPITAIIADFSRKFKDNKANFNKKAKATLAEQFHIAGSSIIPNIDTDERWAKESKKIIEQYQGKLEIEKKKLLK